MLEVLQGLYDAHGAWMLQVFLIVTATVAVHQLLRWALRKLAIRVEKTPSAWDDAIYYAAGKPTVWAIWVVGLSWAGEVIYRHTAAQAEATVFAYVGTAREASVIILLAWFALRIVRSFELSVQDQEDQDDSRRRWDLATANAVGKVLRASISITAFLILLQVFGFSIQGVLAFGGIGGLAIGFAARDLLANFFGALMLFVDKPFTVGDWIRSPDKEIEGTVEEIGWRVTRIRTFDQRPLYVPNSTFTSLSVENPQRMRNRRIYETFGVRYDDFGAVKKIVDDVRDMLKNHPEIDLNRTLMVNVVSYGDFAVEFFVYTFTKTTVWTEYHEIKEDVLLKIGEIILDNGAEFAFPTQTLHLPPQPEPDEQ